ncbi:MAG: MFS transporter [Chloroflexota bacterium]|nr:MFS transporter [Chloroflexota bacterium]
MFLSTIVLALIVGALAGGALPRLAELKLRWAWLLAGALALRLLVVISRETGIGAQIPAGGAYMLAYGLIFAWLWGNWRVPGLQIASVGIGANMLAVLVNGGQMPIWSAAFFAAGFSEAEIFNDPFHFLLRTDTVAGFVASGGLFGDVIPLPIPYIRDVVSIGDVLLALGIFWAIVYSMTRAEAPSRGAIALGQTPMRQSAAGTFETGLVYAGASAIPARAGRVTTEGVAVPRPQSPYLRLVRNRNFSLLWVGQLISLLGDRIHVIALGALVAGRGTDLEVGLTFASTAVPSVVLGPLAGVLVDRWDRRITMIACDVVRALLVLAVPFVFEIHIGLVYLAGFLISTVTLLFRPAKTAVVPAVVERRDLVSANSAMSVPETAADLIGFPVAGLIVTALSSVIGAAFVLDAGTYIVSAVLIWAMLLPRQVEEPSERISVAGVWREMREGFAFLWSEAALLSNTLLSTLAQVAVGAEIVVSLLYARDIVDRGAMSFEQMYSLLLTAIAVGSVLAGIGVGALGDRLPKGPLVIAGFIGMGLSLVVAGLVTDPIFAIVAFFFTGATNMLFIIPTVTLFQQRTPQRLMGRVVSSRQALVFGSIAASMALSGWLAGLIGAATVLIVSGGICAAAGLIGLGVPSMRNAR